MLIDRCVANVVETRLLHSFNCTSVVWLSPCLPRLALASPLLSVGHSLWDLALRILAMSCAVTPLRACASSMKIAGGSWSDDPPSCADPPFFRHNLLVREQGLANPRGFMRILGGSCEMQTALRDECATSVAWVPVVARGGRTLTESFPFSIAARKVRDVLKTLDEELLALMTA